MGPAELGVPDTGQPYLVLSSLGRSMVYGGVAAKRLLGDKLSGAWAAAGFSQGSIATLEAARYSKLAKEAEPDMDYRGTLSINCVQNSKHKKFSAYWENGQTDCVLPKQIQNKIN
jgi:hypothetical protein